MVPQHEANTDTAKAFDCDESFVALLSCQG
jgi:hypothetical protein